MSDLMSPERLALLHGDRLDTVWSNFTENWFAGVAIELLDALMAAHGAYTRVVTDMVMYREERDALRERIEKLERLRVAVRAERDRLDKTQTHAALAELEDTP